MKYIVRIFPIWFFFLDGNFIYLVCLYNSMLEEFLTLLVMMISNNLVGTDDMVWMLCVVVYYVRVRYIGTE